LREKGEECIVCGADKDILVHHVDGNRGNNDMDNLIPVCERCHTDIHAGKERVAKWVKKLGKNPDDSRKTTIEVSKEVWKRLLMRQTPAQTFDDVIVSALDRSEDENAAHAAHD
jgi:hypothetical protein